MMPPRPPVDAASSAGSTLSTPSPRPKLVLHSRGAWIYVPVSDLGYIVFDSSRGNLNAHCLKPLHKYTDASGKRITCHLNKSFGEYSPTNGRRGRVLGLETFWLCFLLGECGPCTERDEHVSMKFEKEIAGKKYHPDRKAARAYLESLPNTEVLFPVEPDLGSGSDSELKIVPWNPSSAPCRLHPLLSEICPT